MAHKGTMQAGKMGISEVALEIKGVKTGATFLACVHSDMPQALSNQEQGKLQQAE